MTAIFRASAIVAALFLCTAVASATHHVAVAVHSFATPFVPTVQVQAYAPVAYATPVAVAASPCASSCAVPAPVVQVQQPTPVAAPVQAVQVQTSAYVPQFQAVQVQQSAYVAHVQAFQQHHYGSVGVVRTGRVGVVNRRNAVVVAGRAPPVRAARPAVVVRTGLFGRTRVAVR